MPLCPTEAQSKDDFSTLSILRLPSDGMRNMGARLFARRNERRKNKFSCLPCRSLYTPSMLSKICNHCEKEQSLDSFNADRRNKDGKRGLCRACENTRRRKLLGGRGPYKSSSPLSTQQEVKATPFVSRPLPTNLDDVLKKVSEHHRAHFSLSRDRQGKYRLQVHSTPSLCWHGYDLPKLLESSLKFPLHCKQGEERVV